MKIPPSGAHAGCTDWISHVGHGQDFVIFNDRFGFNDDPIGDEDIEWIDITAGGIRESQAWSSGVNWYFVCTPIGIALLRVGVNRGILCRKPSIAFIEQFLDMPPIKRFM